MKLTRPQWCWLLILFLPLTVQASALYLGHNNAEQIIYVGDTQHRLTARGPALLLDIDLSDSWGASVDFSSMDVSKRAEAPVKVDFKSDNYGAGFSYYQETWSAYYQYSVYDDELTQLLDSRPSQLRSATDSVTHSTGAGYYWTLTDNWQISGSMGIHYADFELSETVPVGEPDRPAMLSVERGNAIFVSLSSNLHYWQPITAQSALNAGIFISWNEVIEDSGEVINVTTRDRNPSGSRNRDPNRQNLVASGSESYGLLSIYAALDLGQHWVLDIDTSTDFGRADALQNWNISIGYHF